MMGFENALLSLVMEPEACYDFLQAVADFWIEAWHYQCKYYKPDMGILWDHLATEKGLMMSPTTYREIIKPAQAKVCKAILEEGVMPVMHVDGNVSLILEDYAEMGIQCIKPFQIFNDIEKAKKDYGFLAIGGWDAFGRGNQPDSTEEEVRQSVRDAMDKYAPSGKYAFWSSGVTPRYPDHMRWLEDEAEKYGKKFY